MGPERLTDGDGAAVEHDTRTQPEPLEALDARMKLAPEDRRLVLRLAAIEQRTATQWVRQLVLRELAVIREAARAVNGPA